MIKCNNGGQKIDCIRTNIFNYDGTDSFHEIPIKECPTNAIIFDINSNWCGYGLDEEEQIEHIACPFCNKFPFKQREVQIEEIVRVVMFKR